MPMGALKEALKPLLREWFSKQPLFLVKRHMQAMGSAQDLSVLARVIRDSKQLVASSWIKPRNLAAKGRH